MNVVEKFKDYETNQKVFDKLCIAVLRMEKALYTLTRMRDMACSGCFVGMEINYNGIQFEVIDIEHKKESNNHTLYLLEIRDDDQPPQQIELALSGYMRDVRDLLEVVK